MAVDKRGSNNANEDSVDTPVVMRQRESVVVANVEYETRAAACRAYGVREDTVAYRVNKLGMSVEDAILEPVKHCKRRVIDYDGIHFDSLNAFAKYVGFPPNTLSRWLDAGLSPEEAVAKVRENREKGRGISIRLKYKDEEYASAVQLCSAKGISYPTFMRRLDIGYTVEQAVDIEVRKRISASQGVVVADKYFESIHLACAEYGITYTIADRRMRSYNISFEEALLCGAVSEVGYKIYDNIYESQLAACRAFHVSFGDVVPLLRFGQTFEDALTSVINLRGLGVGRDYIVLKQFCHRKFYLCKCKVCNRNVMIPYSGWKSLNHSEQCAIYEWDM